MTTQMSVRGGKPDIPDPRCNPKRTFSRNDGRTDLFRLEARTSLKAGKLSSKECAHDAAPPYHRLADFPRPPLL